MSGDQKFTNGRNNHLHQGQNGASTGGALPPTRRTLKQHKSNEPAPQCQVKHIHVITTATSCGEGEDNVRIIKRKAESGGRLSNHPQTDCNSHASTKPSQGSGGIGGNGHRSQFNLKSGLHNVKHKANKALNDITGIILNNMKQGSAGSSGAISGKGQKYTAAGGCDSNPGSRVGSHKANVRAGDQTTIIKKGAHANASGHPERFVGSGAGPQQ